MGRRMGEADEGRDTTMGEGIVQDGRRDNTESAGEGRGEAAWAAEAGEPVRLRIDRSVATLTLARPAARNALTLDMVERLHAALDRIEADPTVRLVVLRGEGDHFCAGADIKAFLRSVEAGAAHEVDRFLAREYLLDARLARLPVPLVVIADGITMGGGLGLAFGGYLIATARSHFAMPESRIGFLPDVGAAWELKRRIGLPLARYFCWTAESWGGEEALRWGFADALIDPGQIEPLLQSLGRAGRGEAGPRLNGSAEIAFLHARVAGGVPAFQGRWTTRPARPARADGWETIRAAFACPSAAATLRELRHAAATDGDGAGTTRDGVEREAGDGAGEAARARATLAILETRSPVSIWAADLLLAIDHEALAREANAAPAVACAAGTGEDAGPAWLGYLRDAVAQQDRAAAPIVELRQAGPRDVALAIDFLFASAMARGADFRDGVRAFQEKKAPSFTSRREPLGVHRALFMERAGWALLKHAARLARDPFWIDIAHREIDWIRPPLRGYDPAAGTRALWFADGTLNASVEALDRWVAAGRGAATAFIWEGDRIDADRRPLEQRSITYAGLLDEVRRIAAAFRALGLKRGDTLVLYMPNIIETQAVQLAAARIGVVYHPVFAGFAREELSDRIHMMGARVLVTADGAFRKGEVVQYKRDFVDPALVDFVPVDRALAIAAEVLERRAGAAAGRGIADRLGKALADKVTIEKRKLRAVLAREWIEAGGATAGPGAVEGSGAPARPATAEAILFGGDDRPFLDRIAAAAARVDAGGAPGATRDLTPEEEALDPAGRDLLAEVGRRIDALPCPVDTVIVLRRIGTRAEGGWTAGRDLAWDDFLAAGGAAAEPSASPAAAAATSASPAAACAAADPEPMGAEDPLFVMFTSGSTGKPKGLVHTHGGYLARLPFILRTVFGLNRDQRILTVADPGWITGQSFACWGPLTYGMTSVLPGFVPTEDRLWAAIERYRVNFLKTGVTGIRAAMGDDPEHLRAHDLGSLREGSGPRYTSCSCAEPLDAAVQAWWEAHIGAMQNCWWRTEDAGPETGASPTACPQTPDAAARPLPWAEIGVFVIRDDDGNPVTPRAAAIGEKGTVFVRGNPGIARGTWAAGGDWRTDPRYAAIYHADVPGWHNTGDAAVANADGTLAFLGRDDEVLNVSGHRVGTQEIEGAVRAHPAVANVAAVGIPAEVRGDNPALFVVLRAGQEPSTLLDNQLRDAVAEAKGAHVAPTTDFIFHVPALPVTKSGKILRRLLKYAAALDRDTLAGIIEALGDVRARAGLVAADRETLARLFPDLRRQGRTLRLGSVATVDRMAVILDILLAVARRREIDTGGLEAAPTTATRESAGAAARPESDYEPYRATAGTIHRLGWSDFRPGIDPLPPAQEAWAMTRDRFGRPRHGDPKDALVRIVEPVPRDPEPNEVIVQNLFAGSTHNVLHALLADPVSPFEWHRQPYHVLGSGAVCRVVVCGREVERQGLFHPGELAVNFPATHRVLDPRVSEDAMHAGFEIQGFETPGGTLRPFDRLLATQLLPVPKGVTLEQAASFMLNLVTVHRALTHRMPIARGQSLLVEGATGGTGAHAVDLGRLLGARVIGIVGSPDRGRQAEEAGAAAWIDRTDPAFRGLWTPVPDDPAAWEEWERAGAPIRDRLRERNDGRLVDAVVSFTGRPAFGRLVQMLAPGGRLTFFGAFKGYTLRFLGRPAEAAPAGAAGLLDRAGLRPGMGIVVHYGAPEAPVVEGATTAGAEAAVAATDQGGLENQIGLEDQGGLEDRAARSAIQAAIERRARVAVITRTDAQAAHLMRDAAIAGGILGTVSLESLRRGSRFEWPDRMPDYDRDPARYEHYEHLTLKPLAAAVGRLLRAPGDLRGQPDIVVARAAEDTLAADLFMVKPFTGCVVFVESARRAYTMFAPQVWMRQRRVLFPTFEIIGSHMGNPQQGREVIDLIAQGLIRLPHPEVFEADAAPEAFQAMHDNRRTGSFVVHLTAPGRGLTTEREVDVANGAEFRDEKYVSVRIDAVRGPAGAASAAGTAASGATATAAATPRGTHVARVTLRGEGGRPPALARDAVYQIGDAFARLQRDPRIAAVVLTGEGSVAFLAGQDLRQLYDEVEDHAAALQIARDAQRIFDDIERFPKPVIAVLNGVALGGGHELFMSAHYRIATRAPRVRIGQPEIVLGIIPGFAGTQRLTRLLIDRLGLERGTREAIEMILNGRHYEVDEALALGLLEEAVEGGALQRAHALAAGHARGLDDRLERARGTRQAARDAWSRPVTLPPGFLDGDERIELLLRQAAAPGIGRLAPALRAVEAVIEGLRGGFEAGCRREAGLFAALAVDERHGRKGMRTFLERREPAPLPPRRTEDLSGEGQ
jgi:acrylyl-CoA reductase (NADPH)/3-hydroxypropionyl-CoA dehydratase/3-hydroxypropionyl-CoA synthetase